MADQKPTNNIPNEKEEKLITKVDSVKKELPSLIKRVLTVLSKAVDSLSILSTAEQKAQKTIEAQEKQALQQQPLGVKQESAIKASTNKSAGGGGGAGH